jgi:WD repeat-containing protein 44
MRRKGGSFLNRFRAKKKDSFDTVDDGESTSDKRAEGTDAEAFSRPLGYIPKYPEPPKYIKVRAKAKKDQEFDRVFLAQELRGRTGVEVAQAGGRKINPAEKAKLGTAVWAMEFSKDGRYLAAGGHDHLVRVWAVFASEEDRNVPENQETAEKNGQPAELSAPVFKARPVQEYEGHTSTVLDLSWSKNNFLLSSSMDKTVRLWHISRAECLCAFKHNDFVTSISFHPRDDRFFLAGSMDSKLRLWSIPDKSVAHWTQCNEIVTAVAFTPDGKTSIAGCLSGVCIFYDTEGFRQQTQMHVRSAHGRNAKGSKITGIQAINYPPSDLNGDIKLLITSNDSRIRLYNFRDKALEMKLKGAENASSQIRASFSEDGHYIITGSEDKKAYIWTTDQPEKDKDKRPVEAFEAHSSVVTASIMAPARTRQLLQQSGDPLFDLCNPPPVQLISRTESRSSLGDDHPSVPVTPASATFDRAQPRPRLEDNPQWLARSTHPNGNIIVTADFDGHIKVFRQDCAYKQRQRNNENWDTASTFSKKVLHRSSSIATRNSKHSTRDSLGYPSDRILSWRQSIDRSNITHSPFLNGSVESMPATPHRKTFSRSISPQKSLAGRARNPSSTPQPPASAHPLSTASTPHVTQSSPPSFKPSPSATSSSSNVPTQSQPQSTGPISNARRPPSNNGLLISTDGTADALCQVSDLAAQANSLQRIVTVDMDGVPMEPASPASDSRHASREGRPQAEIDPSGHLLAQPPSRGRQSVEMDSMDRSRSSLVSGGMTSKSSMSAPSEEDEEDEGERCARCGADNFRAKKRGGERVLECVTCGKVAQ